MGGASGCVGPRLSPRSVARDEAAAKELKVRARTKLYNACPQWPGDADAAVDATAVAACGQVRETSEDDALGALLALL